MTRRGLLVAGIALAILGLAAPSSRADATDAHGWWSLERRSVLPVDPPRPGDVPEGGMRIQGSAVGASAVAAVRGSVPQGTAQATISLQIASAAGSPAVTACLTTDDWIPADPGNWDERPECRTEGVDATVGDGRLEATLAIDANRFAVLFIPTTGADVDVVLNPPDGRSVQSPAGDAPDPHDDIPVPTTVITAARSPSADPPPRRSSSPILPATAPITGRPVTTTTTVMRAEDAAAAPAPASSVGPVEAAVGPADAVTSDAGRRLAVILGLGVVVAAAATWNRVGAVPRRILPLGAGRAARDPEPVVDPVPVPISGIGRFAKPRRGTPPPLN